MRHPILATAPLGFPWKTVDPFLFCVHHVDAYPASNGRYGPAASLAGHQRGADFDNADGWRMYHGEQVPGFPPHPHRGFETVTLVRKGWIDHADSLGAAARYGAGDVQWLTAGRGLMHAEMFPLLDTAAPNPLELFQIWLNLPARSKLAPPHFSMFWAADIPRLAADGVELVGVAGALPGLAAPPAPPPDSWAAAAEHEVAIWTLALAPGARYTLPATSDATTRRHLYFFAGARLQVAATSIHEHSAIELAAREAVELHNPGPDRVELLMLQGRPIAEPVVQHGPFVMNSAAEVRQAFDDFQRTQFGGWPWPAEPVHGPEPRRFVRQAGAPSD